MSLEANSKQAAQEADSAALSGEADLLIECASITFFGKF